MGTVPSSSFLGRSGPRMVKGSLQAGSWDRGRSAGGRCGGGLGPVFPAVPWPSGHSAVLRPPPPALGGFSWCPPRCQAGGGRAGSFSQEPADATAAPSKGNPGGGDPFCRHPEDGCPLRWAAETAPNTPTVRSVRWRKVGHFSCAMQSQRQSGSWGRTAGVLSQDSVTLGLVLCAFAAGPGRS